MPVFLCLFFFFVFDDGYSNVTKFDLNPQFSMLVLRTCGLFAWENGDNKKISHSITHRIPHFSLPYDAVGAYNGPGGGFS